MPEPTSSGVSVYGFVKLFFPGLITAMGTAAMYMMMWPKTNGEGFKRLVVSFLCSILFGPILVFYLDSTHVGAATVGAMVRECAPLNPLMLKLGMAGVVIGLSGLPGWYILGWIIRFFENNKDKDAGEVLKEVGDISRKFEP